MERILQHFFPSAIQLRVSVAPMKRTVRSGFHLTNIFIISHSWHRTPSADNTFTGVCFKLCPPKGVRNNTQIHPLFSRTGVTAMFHRFIQNGPTRKAT